MLFQLSGRLNEALKERSRVDQHRGLRGRCKRPAMSERAARNMPVPLRVWVLVVGAHVARIACCAMIVNSCAACARVGCGRLGARCAWSQVTILAAIDIYSLSCEW